MPLSSRGGLSCAGLGPGAAGLAGGGLFGGVGCPTPWSDLKELFDVVQSFIGGGVNSSDRGSLGIYGSQAAGGRYRTFFHSADV